jgi:DNA-binding response OmpR family regulator
MANLTVFDPGRASGSGTPNRIPGIWKAAKQPAALLISADPTDEAFFAEVFLREKWRLSAVCNLNSAAVLLRDQLFPVMITDRDLPAGDWRDVLTAVQGLENAPLLIVTARLADDYLWSEVLNLGGQDVLAKPLDTTEVRRVLIHAWQRWEALNGPCAARYEGVPNSSRNAERLVHSERSL